MYSGKARTDAMFGPVQLPFVLVNNGQEGSTIHPTPPGGVLITFKRVGASSQQSKVDQMSALLRQIGSRLGLTLDLTSP